jgi:hypothetical protein
LSALPQVTDAGASARATATTDAHAHAKSARVIRFATFDRFVGIVDVTRVEL